MSTVSLRSFAVLFALAWIAASASAQEGDDSAAGDDGGAPADTSAERVFLSSDGAVSVFEEATPGEGIEGFWWEYDATADLQRLLDKERKEQILDPLVDAFGFELAIPDTIRDLRDSVTAVADSILAERIDVSSVFDPKLKSTYNESKDQYSLKNSLEAAVPLTNRGTVTASANNNLTYNEATRRGVDTRAVQSTFNFRFRDGMVSSFSVNRTEETQERNGVRDTESKNTVVSGTSRFTEKWRGTDLETKVGLSVNRRDYNNSATDGGNRQLSPSWGAKLTRPYQQGSFSVSYDGNYGRSSRQESRLETKLDENGNPILDEDNRPILEKVTTDSKENNFNNQVKSTLNHDFNENYDLVVNGGFSRDSFQYISQADSLRGQQETRTRASESVRATLNASPTARLKILASGDLSRNENRYELEDRRSTVTKNRSADVDITYDSWKEGRFIVKMGRSHEDREYKTSQAGIVEKFKASADFKQQVTANIEFNAAYFITLDRFAFDDTEANTGDRDLRNQRGTFIVRYNPRPALSTSVKMEVRENDSINMHRSKSGDNKTDFAYLITPDYNWKIGKANINGEFNADVRYQVFDFREDDNDLTRRFSTRHKWQHAFSERFSSSLLLQYELSDQGSYTRSPVDGIRRYARARETRRSRQEVQVLYNTRWDIKTRALYRRDADDTYIVRGDEKVLADEQRTYEFTYGADMNRRLTDHIRLNVKFSQTRKKGDQVSRLDKNFYTILAALEYQPMSARK